ncbi:MAG: hypothetical protein KME64_27260 [Scytonematopsis contorta HA4267-MV1]|jgi:hypothetical protein|nr:hypothetical protein [Scytonematopsis contorta HA4267-MV1]
MDVKWIFCPIDGSFIKENFDCGIPELNDYLKKYARQNDKKGITKTFVVIPESGDKVVAGYYSIRMNKIEFEVIPEKYKKGLPRYPHRMVNYESGCCRRANKKLG